MRAESRAAGGPLRTLVIAPWARRLGGAEEMLWTFARTHDPERLGLSVIFLESGPLETEMTSLGIPTAVVESGQLRSPWRVASTVARLAGAIRRQRPHVVLNWMAKTQLYGAPAVMLSGTRARVVWWQHLIPAGHWMDRLATRLPAAAIGASSEASARAQRCSVPSRRTVCVHPGIEAPAAVPAPAPRARAELGLGETATVVVLVGRLQPWKGQDRAIHATRLLRNLGLDVQLLVVGGSAFGFDANYPDTLRCLVAELDLEQHVRFVGQVDDVTPYLRIGDVALSASESEPFGIVLIEAMALGLPVVAVRSAGPLEITDDGRAGRLATGGSPQELAAAIGPLVDDAAERRRLGEAGRSRVSREFSAASMSRGIAELLESAAA